LKVNKSFYYSKPTIFVRFELGKERNALSYESDVSSSVLSNLGLGPNFLEGVESFEKSDFLSKNLLAIFIFMKSQLIK